MLSALSSLFSLRWTQTPQLHPLPPIITRHTIPGPAGDLELLVSHPTTKTATTDPPIFFIHGGCGHAAVWLDWMTALRAAGYRGPLHAYSARGHGASHALPYARMVFGTSLDALAADLVAGVHGAAQLDGARAGPADMLLVAHSSGAGLAQHCLARRRLRCRALCLLDGVPHFGNLSMYANWLRHDPFFPLRSALHLGHPNSPLSTPALVHAAFFSPAYPLSAAEAFAAAMPAYESMGWAMGMRGSFAGWWGGKPAWLDPRDVLQGVAGAGSGDGVCVMVGGEDMMLDARIRGRQVAELRAAGGARREKVSEERAEGEMEGADVSSADGVRLVVVRGAGHHLQNDVQRDVGAEALVAFARQC